MTELTGMTAAELSAWVKEQGMPAFRGKQIFRWIHQGADFDEMTNLPLALREKLKAELLESMKAEAAAAKAEETPVEAVAAAAKAEEAPVEAVAADEITEDTPVEAETAITEDSDNKEE